VTARTPPEGKARTKPELEPEKFSGAVPAVWRHDSDKGIAGSRRVIRTLASAYPGPTRRLYAAMLRAELARIESMPDDSADDEAKAGAR